MRTTFVLAAALLAGCAGSAALAQTPGGGAGEGGAMGDATVPRAAAQARISQEFDALDTNKDGALSEAEVAAMRLRAGPPMREGGGAAGRGMAMMMRRMDTNGDGKILKDEFVGASMRRFDMADANKDGRLTKAERDAAREAMRARFRARMGEGGSGGFKLPPADDGDE